VLGLQRYIELLGFDSFLLECKSAALGRFLENALRGAILNAIKGYGFPHWTPISFQMK
jgi:hypothetical protein